MARNNFREMILMLLDLGIRKWRICKEFKLEFEELEEVINGDFDRK